MSNFALLLAIMVLTTISIVFSALTISPIDNSQLLTFINTNINVAKVFQGIPSNQTGNLTLENTGLCDEYSFFVTGYKAISTTNGHASENITHSAYNVALDTLYKQQSPVITLANGGSIPTSNLTVFAGLDHNQSIENSAYQVIVTIGFAFAFDALTLLVSLYALPSRNSQQAMNTRAFWLGLFAGCKEFILLVFIVPAFVTLRDYLNELVKDTGITIKYGSMVYAFTGVVCGIGLIHLGVAIYLMSANPVVVEEVVKKKLDGSVNNVPKFTDKKEEGLLVKNSESTSEETV